MSFKVATWNVNSLRVRLPHVIDWLAAEQPDVLVLQETKMPDSDFPAEAIQQAGYHVAFSGQKTYNGVAVLSKEAGTDIVTDLPGLADPQRRVLGITIGTMRILNLYVPNGESITSDKYQYKLGWLEKLAAFVQTERNQHPNMVILGDFNIAPDDRDVHDPLEWEGQVLCSAPERDALQVILNIGFVDCFRLEEQPEKAFSWWDYRLNSFKRNRGLRIDLILASEPLVSRYQKCYIDKMPRTLERPSDHTPVVVEFQTI
jgi:exodeoxyribonuclease-3